MAKFIKEHLYIVLETDTHFIKDGRVGEYLPLKIELETDKTHTIWFDEKTGHWMRRVEEGTDNG